MEQIASISEQPVPLLAQLRSATHAQHRRAETVIGLPQSLGSHTQILKTFYGFIEPWEAKVWPLLTPLASQLQGRGKAHLLLADLENLGVSEADLLAIPRCNRLLPIKDLLSALGSMYVFEGATLGGQILSRHVEKQLGLANGIGYCFYQSYGPRVGPMWRGYCELLTQNTPVSAYESVIQSANSTFHSLCDWFEA